MRAAGSSVMMASALAAMSLSHWEGVLAVQGTIWRPAAWASATREGVTRE